MTHSRDSGEVSMKPFWPVFFTAWLALPVTHSLSAAEPAFMNVTPALLQPPRTEPAPGFQSEGVKALFYEGLPWKGKPTRVFAWLGLPKLESGKKAPGIVLVHGGGGTAFAEWVRLWTGRGYAALAMDTCGSVPQGTYGNWKRHDAGGPPGWGGLDEMDLPMADQWPSHAVADVVLANSLLRSLPEVDADRVGITGISWGGYLTCVASGLDSRLAFAAPVYGCGFLGDNSVWVPELKKRGAAGEKWLALWDPSKYLKGARMPKLWVTGTNDFAYPLDSLQKSYRLAGPPFTLCIRLRMPHGHNGPGENPPEIRAFADSIVNKTTPLATVTGTGREGTSVRAAFRGGSPIVKAELLFTKDSGPWPDRKWENLPAMLGPSTDTVTATLPEGTKVYYFNLIDGQGLVVSTEHEQINE